MTVEVQDVHVEAVRRMIETFNQSAKTARNDVSIHQVGMADGMRLALHMMGIRS